jgi:alkylation response protein AidB-like acyl-CoA dehydrogenase
LPCRDISHGEKKLKKMIDHPSSLLSADLVKAIRDEMPEAERSGLLTATQIDIIRRNRWFHLFVPKDLQGSDLSLPDAVRLEESIAWADGSTGWVVTLCAGAAMFVGYFDDGLAREVFSEPNVCIAGSGQATGTALRTGHDFVVNGSWDYSSGAPHATHFTANCVVEGEEVRSFIFKRNEVTLSRNWDYMGLNATAGHSFSVRDLKLPLNRSFLIDPSAAVLPAPVYRYPFLQLAHATLAVNLSGMSVYFFDLAAPLMKSIAARHQLEYANQALQSLRGEFYAELDHSWQLHLMNEIFSLQKFNKISIALAQECRELVDSVYPFCGLIAARKDTPVNQVWRNIHTASQHALLNHDN